MITIINCAKKRHGKTTIAKGLLNTWDGEKLIYDVNGEYKEYGSAAIFPRPYKKFLEIAVQKKNTAIVFEEAYIYMKSQADQEEIKELLIRNSGHTKNLLIFNFHAVRQIPIFCWDYANYLVLGKTNDKPKWIDSNYRDTDIRAAFYELQASEDKYKKITLNIDKDGI